MIGSVKTSLEVELVSADLSAATAALGKAGIGLRDVVFLDALSLRFRIDASDWPKVERIVQSRADRVRLLRRDGLAHRLQALWHRPVLVVGLLALFLFTLWVPTRVFFVQVEGNTAIPAAQILDAAADCGLNFGAVRRDIRSEKIKNALLEALPELQWVGVNTYGCRAVLTVQERETVSEQGNETHSVSSIVAARDGIVRQITVLRGNGLCQAGQVVKAGEVLISGYTDCGICIQATDAAGEIYADTQRRLTAILPTQYAQRTTPTASTTGFSLLIGKKRINLWNNSGISARTCAKIYEEKYLTLPGGFTLPIAICRQRCYNYAEQERTVADAETILADFAANYLPAQMSGGRICQSNAVYFHADGTSVLEGVYGCYEMIGRKRPEEHLYG